MRNCILFHAVNNRRRESSRGSDGDTLGKIQNSVEQADEFLDETYGVAEEEEAEKKEGEKEEEKEKKVRCFVW